MSKLRNFKALKEFYYSFPIQLLVNHFKKNQILLLLWVVLFGFVTQSMGSVLGIPYLFLDPEYMYHVDYKGFIIIGVSVAIFIMSFHITTYILDSYRFSFLGTVSRPFTKFCINNSLIPLAFVIVYSISIINFQYRSGFQTIWEILLEVGSFLAAISVTLFIIFIYFRSTNKDIFKELAGSLDKQLKRNPMNRVNVLRKLNTAKRNKYRVNNFIDLPLTIQKVPQFNTYDKEVLSKIFDQNHLNAVIVEIFVIILIIILGLFRDNHIFQIPAAASGILFFSIFVMFTGAFSYWLRGWALTALAIGMIGFNFLIKTKVIDTDYQAFGINYNTHKAEYNLSRLSSLSSPEIVEKDYQETLRILENWKSKFSKDHKPKMVFICTSGGGQRAALWTMRTLQFADSTLGGKLMSHTMLMTGASGGLVGSAYFRELYLRKVQGEPVNIYDEKYFNNISKDMLNPIVFSLVVNDIFFRFQKFSDGKYEYLKDRGYAFEQQLNRNTEYFMNKRVIDYKEPEQKGLIPILIASPTVINDGRKLFISSQNISYMTTPTVYEGKSFPQKTKGIEFLRFFEEQDSENLHFLSALRMSATFPYITPNVELPSSPAMEIMDAGLSDNFGIRDAIKFLFVFKNWIEENTSGVVFVNIRDSEKNREIQKKSEPSIFQKIFAPIGSLYNNWDYLQDFNNDFLLEYAQSWFKNNLDVIEFEYIPEPESWEKLKRKKINVKDVADKEKTARAALSWHLTTREKESIERTILEENNLKALIRLENLLRD